jgi:hypothetical protein
LAPSKSGTLGSKPKRVLAFVMSQTQSFWNISSALSLLRREGLLKNLASRGYPSFYDLSRRKKLPSNPGEMHIKRHVGGSSLQIKREERNIFMFLEKDGSVDTLKTR